MLRLPAMAALGLSLTLFTLSASAGPLDPDCDAGKAAKSAAMKATVGVGGRCTPKEAASDTAKEVVGLEEKGPLEKRTKEEEGVAKKATKKVLD